MKYLLIIFLIPFFTTTGFSQDIKQLWHKFKEGSSSERVKAAEELSFYYQSEAKDSLRSIGEELFFYGIDEHYFPAIEKGKFILSEYYILTGKTTEGIATAKALLSNMQERGDEKELCATSKLISQGYRIEKDAKSAFYWAEKAVKHSQKSLDPSSRTEGLISLAEAYLLKNESNKAIETYQKYLRLAVPLKNERGLSSAYARLGDIYRLKGDLKEAEKYFTLSYEKAKKANLITPIGHALNNLAIIYFEKGDSTAARINFVNALNLRLKATDVKAISESYFNLGDYHYYIDQPEKAAYWYNKSLSFASANNLKNEQFDALKALAELAKSSEDFKSATHYLEQGMALNQQIRIQELADEEELAELHMEMLRVEARANISSQNNDNGKFLGSIKWEWLVIALFATLLVIAYLKRRTS